MAINQEGMADDVKFSTLAKLNIYFIVSKKTKNAAHLMKQMEDAYLALKEEGRL